MIHPWNLPIWRALPPFERLPPALLLAGPDGVGKAAFADALAQALLCQAPTADAQACGQCHACRLYDGGNHPDARLLEPLAAGEEGEGGAAEEGAAKAKASAPARWIKVDAVRALNDFLGFSAHLGGRRTIVIRPADRLHPSAANALLKTLEEPPAATHFILVTGRPARLPATVRSRCVRILFSLPPVPAAVDWLTEQGSSNPGVALPQAGFAPLAALALDTPEYWSSRKALLQTVFAAPAFDPVAVVDAIGTDQLPMLVTALQRWCHDLVMLGAGGPVRYNPDCAQILHPIARRASRQALVRFARQLGEVARTVEHPLNPRLVAEQCLIGYRNATASS